METSKRICKWIKQLETIKKDASMEAKLKGMHEVYLKLEKEYLQLKRIRNYIGFIRDTRK